MELQGIHQLPRHPSEMSVDEKLQAMEPLWDN